MTYLRLLVAALALAFAAPPAPAADPPADAAHAADAGHEKGELLAPLKQGLPAMIAAFLVFGVVYVALQRLVWPRIVRGLDSRAAKIREEIDAAERARAQAREALQEYERSLAEARAQAKRMLDETKAQQQAFAAELRAKAERELQAMKDRARREIDAARRAALSEISAHASSLAVAIASRILEREVRPEDHQRLVEESLARLDWART
jgi:F-type H+-transporting ATPase subunit b